MTHSTPLPRTFLATLALIIGVLPSLIHAQTDGHDLTAIPDADAPYQFVTVDISLEQALRIYSRNLRIRLIIENEIDAKAVVTLPSDLTRLTYLDQLALENDLVWYFDGMVLRVSTLESLETKILILESISGPDVMATLGMLGLLQPKFIHIMNTRRGVLRVSAPASYVTNLETTITNISAATPANTKILRGGSDGGDGASFSLDAGLASTVEAIN